MKIGADIRKRIIMKNEAHGDIRYDSSVERQPLLHWHDEMEILYVTEGTMHFYIDNKKVQVERGEVFVINSRVLHRNITEESASYSAWSVVVNAVCLTADMQVRREILDPLFQSYGAPYYRIHANEGAEEIGQIIVQIHEVEAGKDVAYKAEKIGWLHLLLSKLYRRFPPVVKEKGYYPDDASMQKDMISYIRQHYGEKVTLEDVARAGRVSRSRCCTLFKKYVHQSPIRFLNAYRLEMGRSLLRDTNRAVMQIAFDCGFGSQSYFTKMFVDSFGMTPKQYRENVRQEGALRGNVL